MIETITPENRQGLPPKHLHFSLLNYIDCSLLMGTIGIFFGGR